MKDKITFNYNHPEMNSNEMFVTNTANPNMDNIGWKSKRLGVIAYNTDGKPVNGLYPVFKSTLEA
jgi:hypothetical protein